jgi:hypothetical protein
VTTSVSRLIAFACVAGCARPAATPHASSPTSSQHVAAPPSPVPARQSAGGELAALAGQPLVVLPVQTLRLAVPGWSEKIGDDSAYRATLDDEIAFAVRERRIRGKWAFPPDLARAARRNPTYAADPYTIALDPLRPVEKDADKMIGEPLAGQLRALAALFDARYALIPVEIRLAPDGDAARATLHLVVVDARQARLTWKGDVTGEPVRTFSPAVAAGLAGRVADLFTTTPR